MSSLKGDADDVDSEGDDFVHEWIVELFQVVLPLPPSPSYWRRWLEVYGDFTNYLTDVSW